jgi:hypothetical protein
MNLTSAEASDSCAGRKSRATRTDLRAIGADSLHPTQVWSRLAPPRDLRPWMFASHASEPRRDLTPRAGTARRGPPPRPTPSPTPRPTPSPTSSPSPTRDTSLQKLLPSCSTAVNYDVEPFLWRELGPESQELGPESQELAPESQELGPEGLRVGGVSSTA